MKPIEIKYRKLGKEKADGLAWKEDNIIEIDSRLKGMNMLETLIHEVAHIQNKAWGEIKVTEHSKQLAQILWDAGFRKVDL
jgi:hypothetical protein